MNNETFDVALQFFSELKKQGLGNMTGEERVIFEK
jgi:hypothetical protein